MLKTGVVLLVAVVSFVSARVLTDTQSDPRFAYVNIEDDGVRLSANSTSLVYGVVGVLVVAVMLLLLVPLLESFGVALPRLDGTEAFSGYEAAGHDTYSGYSSLRSIQSALPILRHLQEAWTKYN